MTIQEALNFAIQRHQAGQLREAEAAYRQILAQQPNHPDALHMLGVLAFQCGRHDAAVQLIRQSITLQPTADSYCNLGLALAAAGQLDHAVAAYQTSISLDPQVVETYFNLAIALRDLGRHDDSINAYRQALLLQPGHVQSLINMGSALRSQGKTIEAAAAFRQAIAINSNHAAAHHNLANTLKEQTDLDPALFHFDKAISLGLNDATVQRNRANALVNQGQLEKAIAGYDRAMVLRPTDPALASGKIIAMQLHPDYDAATIRRECEDWDRQYAQPLRQLWPDHSARPRSSKRLRIGYISPDFRDHVIAWYFAPILSRHDRREFEIFSYASVAQPDATTRRLESLSDGWRNIHALTDDQAAEVIRADRIDILVDLDLHVWGNRLPVLARKPAPVQVSWLGYPGTTGIAAMDYRLTDPFLDPPGEHDDWYTEKSLRLPNSFWCFDPQLEPLKPTLDLPTGDLPAIQNGYVTFGSLNNVSRLNPRTLKLWSRVVTKVPNSRLLLSAPHGSARENILGLLAQHGVEASRVEFVASAPWTEYMGYFRRIDIALDTLPYNGHTTSLDALWMGVPLVTRLGQTVVGRAGYSHLSNLQLTELAATTDDDFVTAAENLAGDLSRLIELRRTLRERMLASPLTNATQFTRDLETGFQQMRLKI